jgi:phytoene dehydrogenase-like protein
VLFPDNYDEEFADLFDRERAPVSPTVYVNAQEAAHGRTGWADHEPLFVMANAPAEPKEARAAPQDWGPLRTAVHERMVAADLLDRDDVLCEEHSPTWLADRFPGSRGSIYGAASNSMFAAFMRAPNRVHKVPGLYVASGSAHPGGGVPLCVQSGRLAAEAAHQDLSR